jgi:hypothetical protein
MLVCQLYLLKKCNLTSISFESVLRILLATRVQTIAIQLSVHVFTSCRYRSPTPIACCNYMYVVYLECLTDPFGAMRMMH